MEFRRVLFRSAAMGSGVPLGRARTDVSSMNAPLPNAVWHIRPSTGSERSLHFEGGPAPVCRAARLRLIYDGKSRFTPQASAALPLVVPVPTHQHFPLVQSRAIPPQHSCREPCSQLGRASRRDRVSQYVTTSVVA